MNNESRKWLYDNLNAAGYNVGKNYEEFDSLLTNNEESRRWAYDTANSLGYNVGKDYAEFSDIIAPRAPKAEDINPTTKGGENGYIFTANELGIKEPKKKSRARQKWEAQKAERNKEDEEGAAEFNLTDEDRERMAQSLQEKTNPLMSNAQNVSPNLDYGRPVADVNAPTEEEVQAALPAANKKLSEQMQQGITTAGALDKAYQTTRKTELLKDERKRLEDERDKVRERAANRRESITTNAGTYQYGMAPITGNAATEINDLELSKLAATENQLNQAIREVDRELSGEDVGFWQGFADATIRNPGFYTFGLSDMNDARALLNISENGVNSDTDRALLDATYTNSLLQADADRGFMYRAGNQLGHSLPFMIQMAVTGGGSGISNLGSKAAQKYATQTIKHRVARATGVLADDLLESAFIVNTAGGGSTQAKILQNKTGQLKKDAEGNYHFEGKEGWLEAAYKGEVSAILEMYTEKLGGHLDGKLSITKGLESIGASWLSKALTHASKSDIGKAANAIFSQFGINGVLSEVMEEEANIILNSMFVGENKFSDLFDLQTQIDIVGGMFLSVGTMRAIPGTIGSAGYMYNQRLLNRADKEAEAAFGEKWPEMRERLNDATNENVAGVVYSMTDGENTNVLLDYYKRMMIMRGYNIGTTKKEGTIPSAEAAYQEGYEAPDEQKSAVKQAYDMERERALSTFGEEVVQLLDDDPISTLAAMTEVDRAEAIDYVNAKTAYEGMIDRINADIDERIAASDKEIESHKNKQDGAIHPAMMRGINGAAPKRVYIVNGNVATFEDGTIDTANSSSMIIVRDAETGEVSAASADDLESLDAVIDTEAEKKTVAEQIANEYAAQKAAVIENGMVNGENGELTYNSNDGVHTVEILGENGDVFTILDNGVERIATREWVDELKAQNGVVSPVEENAPAATTATTEMQPAPIAQVPKTALEQIPRNENNIPLYEQVDSELAWDGVVEEAGGNEETAMVAVNSMVEDKKKALAAAEKAKAKAGATIAEKIAAENKRIANLEKAKADLAKWEEIAGVKAKRAAAQAESVAQPVAEIAPVESAPVAEETQPTVEEQPIEQVAEVAPVQEESGSLEIPNSSTVSQASEQVIDHYTLNSAGNSTQMLKDMEAVRKSNREEYGKITPAYELFYKAKERGLYPNELEELRAIVKGTSLEGKVDGWFTPVMAEGGNAPDNGSVLLSDEVDENGRQFVLNSKGEIAFGEIAEDTGLTPAPILLSEGLITDPATNDGYGLVHIEARHGDQIRNAGYNSVVEFVEEVAKNYEVIREGKDRDGHQTYMLQLTDKHNNTLMVELSGDGTYWNINTAGIFKTSYGKNRKEVYNRHTTAKQSTETVEASQDTEQSGTQATSSMNAPTTSSASEDTTQSANEQENTQKSGETAENGGENAVPEWLNKVPDDGRNFFVYVKFAGENKYQAIDLGKGETVDRLVRATMLQKEQLQALVDKLPSVLLEDAEFQIRDAKGNIYYNSGKVAAGNEVAKQEDKEVAVATEDELDIYLAEMKAAQERQKAFAQKTPPPSFFVKAYTENDAEVIKKLDKQFNDVLQTLVPMDIPAIEATIKGMKERKRLIKDNENPNYKAFDHIEKALAKRKKQLEKELTEDDKRRLDIIKRGNRGELKETPQPKQENKPVESEPIRAEAPVTSETTESESKQEVEKIEDVGEVLAGARKDALKVLASSFDNATVKSLIELPFSKAFKKPDLKKAVESGALREEDALFYEAMFNALINSSKPKNSARHRNAVETWAEETYNSLQLIKSFVEADEAARDRAMAEALEDKFPARAEELAVIEKRKVWNARNNAEWGDKTTPNPVWVAHEVLKALGYKPGDKVEIPFGVLKANVFATGYEFYNKKGERLIMQSVPTVEEGIENIVWLSKIKRGDADTMHPVSSFFATPTKRDMGDSGRYYVLWGTVRNPRRSEFGSIEEANAFAAGHKEAVVRPIQEVVKRYGYKLIFREPITGDKFFVNDMEFETEGEAMQYLEDNYDAVNEQTNDLLAKERGEAKKEVSADDLLEVAMVRGKEGWKYAVNIKGKYANNMGMPLLLREFDTREDAKAFLNESKNEVFEIYKKQQAEQKKFVFFDTGENSRIGEDYRGGRDVTAKDFMDTFGFRGVQFGNWTNQEDRQMAVNQAFDAFMDLAKLLGVSPKALSLNGELGMAFGSRGSGFGNAHYELGEIVINLTKTRGAGSLAHEWWHALDNYFARRANVPMGMVTDSRSIDMRPELRQAYNELLKMIEKSDFYKRSKAKGDYWGRMHEVTARLMAEWVDQSLKDRGELNTFLSRGVNEERYKRMNYDVHRAVALIKGKEALSYEEFEKTPEALAGFPYPSRAELKEFGDAMRNIFETVEEQETEEGDVVLYRGDEDVPRLNKHKVEKIFGGIWIEDKEEFAKFVSAVNNYAFEENGQGIAYTDSNFYAYYLNIDGQVIPYASVKLTAEQSQEVVNQVNQEIENVREGERVKKYIDTGLERAWSIQDKDNAQPLNNSGASNRRRNGGVVSDLLRKGRYFDNPGLYVKTQRADRFGFLTPSQIERTGNGEVANSARQRRRMAEKARQVAEKLNLDNVEVLESTEGLTGKKATSKGWFDPRTGKITVVVPNHGSTGDIVETVLHEAVAHYGLRKLFGENFKNFLDNVYRNVTPEIRAEITELAKKHGWDFHTATEEYLASLAENTNFEKVNPSLWSNIKSFFMKMLAKVGITLDEPLGDNELRYILWRSHQNLVNPGWFNVFGQAEDIAKQYELGVGNYASGEVKTENGEVAAEDDSALLHREGGAPGSAQATDEPMSFDEIKTAPLTFEEKITQGVLTASALNKKNLDLRQQALREFGRDLTRLLTLMKEQRAYDKSTVDLLVKLSRLYFENAQVLDKMSAYNVKRIMGVLNNAIGKRNITDDANRLLGILMDAHTKELNNLLDTFVKTRATKMNTAGVEIIGSLDKHGQMVLATYKAAVEYDPNKIDAELLKAENELTDESKVVREEAASRLEGLLLAKEYKDEIKSKREDIAELEKEIKDKARQAREGTLDRSAYREFKRATQEAITKSNLELIGAYHALIQKMSTGIGAASARAREFMKKQLEHVQEIQHDANSDMEGKSADTQGEIPDNWNNSIARIVMGPMVTFQGILKKLGEKSVDGKGYLYNRFMKQITNAGHRLWKKKVGNLLSLNGKLSEIFGREMQYNDLYAIDKKGKGMTITYVENGGPKEIELSQGQMMYLYMINKMSDGAMKLRGMGITESAVLQIEGALMPELKTFADWVQATFLNEKRTEYNEVHERMFGSAMANIEDYFPIKINTKSLTKEEDVALKNVEDKPSTVTGSIIKRTRNAAPVDLSANAIDVLMEHLDKMEQWAAFAETNRDLNSLLSYKRFRNQVLNMKTRRFGSGKKLWENFRDVCALASRNYTPKTSDVDRAVTNITKGVTASKISFRLFTAMKQLLSAPAFYTETDVKELYKAYKSPKESWDWAIENLPGFAERWQSRQSGNERLKTTDADWDIWKNKYIKGAQRAGMLPNAWVDAVVVSTGARAVYLTKLKQFKAAGYEADVAEVKALQAAAEAYNESQQSSEGAYLSAMQADRTVISTILTVFKNSNFGYTRKTAQSVANLAKHLKKGNKAQSTEFMAKQMMREGLTEEQARKYADKLWKESILRDSADVAMFGFLLNALWALGPELIYLFGGDDEEEKEKSWTNVVMGGLLSPVAGLGGGDFVSDVVTAAIDGRWENIELPGLPAFGDMENIYSLMEYDPVRGATELLNMLVSAGVGVNPKTFTDMYAAIASTDFTNPEELGLFALKFVNAPQGQIDRLMADKALENGGDNLAAVTAEYMEYKKRYNTPLLGGLYSDEGERKAYERYAKRFKRQVNERLGNVAEDDTAFAMYYEDASPELRSLLTGLREKYIEGDKEPLEPKAVADIAFETLYGKKELNTEYLKLATPDDVDALIELKQKRSELSKFKEALDALPPEQKGEFYKANADALTKYNYLDQALREISKLQKAMTLNKEADQEILDGIRRIADAVSARITSAENN